MQQDTHVEIHQFKIETKKIFYIFLTFQIIIRHLSKYLIRE